MNLAAIFDLIGFACLITGFFLRLIGRQQPCRAFHALAWLSWYCQDVALRDRSWQVVDAGLFAWWAWQWWKGGGGDGTKRRLRKLARRFTPVRRTAPSPA